MRQLQYCCRCKKRIAVVFMQKLDENGKATSEGYCIQCARELGIKPVNDFFKNMGISEEDLDSMGEEMENMLENGFGVRPDDDDGDGEDEDENDMGHARSVNLGALFGKAARAEEDKTAEDASEETDEKTGEPKKKKKGRKSLEAFCTDLTGKARRGEIDRVIGRERELERVMQILCRRQKNNPCLIGEPGVGKTAVAEALALRIAEGKVPYKLRDKEVYLVDMTAIVAGTQFRGQFENRMKGLIEEVKNSGTSCSSSTRCIQSSRRATPRAA